MTRVASLDENLPPRTQHCLKVAREYWSERDPDKTKRVSLGVLKDHLLYTSDCDALPNLLVTRLLQEADKNQDGYLNYEEYLSFAEAAGKETRGRERLTNTALAVLPRFERTVKKRTYLQEFRCCPPPLFMITAALVEIGVFVYYASVMDEPVTENGPTPIKSPLIYNPFRRYEAWRYVSYTLIHSGYVHLTTNLIMQTFLGVLLELVHGWWRVGVIYLSGVLAGSLSQSLASPRAYLAGASGGVFAMSYAHVGNLLMNWSEMQYRWFQLVFTLFVTITDLSVALYDSFWAPNPSNTGHMAHLGGGLAGVLVGINLLRNLEKKRWERCCWWVALLLFLMCLVSAVLLNIFLPVPDFFPYGQK
ncbi:hypothetical protein Pcinc_028728 [Petrolisthes cinctipes]|uniref:EF-hand domain-containing protein n=1 Tax=Petrolisthes cinctipes TaxID=88211 RepID=A0AAE1K4Z7_PETCI|nr:hypothetical protein Pcinc_028728 [Petrolisthes cinctipes]